MRSSAAQLVRTLTKFSEQMERKYGMMSAYVSAREDDSVERSSRVKTTYTAVAPEIPRITIEPHIIAHVCSARMQYMGESQAPTSRAWRREKKPLKPMH